MITDLSVSTIVNKIDLTISVEERTIDLVVKHTTPTIKLFINSNVVGDPNVYSRLDALEEATDGLDNGIEPLAYYILAKNT